MNLVREIRYCSSCFAQNLELKHVDMEAYYDGPAILGKGEEAIPVDDLILCSECLETAGELVGLYPAELLKEENLELGSALEAKNDEIIALHELISDLERTLAKISDEKIQRPARKPRIVERV